MEEVMTVDILKLGEHKINRPDRETRLKRSKYL